MSADRVVKLLGKGIIKEGLDVTDDNVLESAFRASIKRMKNKTLQKGLKTHFTTYLKQLKQFVKQKHKRKLAKPKKKTSLHADLTNGRDNLVQDLSALDSREESLPKQGVEHSPRKMLPYVILNGAIQPPGTNHVKELNDKDKMQLYTMFIRGVLDTISADRDVDLGELFKTLGLSEEKPKKNQFVWLDKMDLLMKASIGCYNDVAILRVMKQLVSYVTVEVEHCIEKDKQIRAKKLAATLKPFLLTLNMKRPTKSAEMALNHATAMASLLSLYVDMVLVHSKKLEKKKAFGRELCGFVCYLLNNWPVSQLEVLLQVNCISTDTASTALPLIRRILSVKPNRQNNDHYLKYMLVVKTLSSKLSEELADIQMEARMTTASAGFLKWLGSICPAALEDMPINDKRFKGASITAFLLDEVDEEFVSLLLDSLYSTATDEAQPEPQPESTTSEVAQLVPSSPPSADLFFLDTGNTAQDRRSRASEIVDRLIKETKRLSQDAIEDNGDGETEFSDGERKKSNKKTGGEGGFTNMNTSLTSVSSMVKASEIQSHFNADEPNKEGSGSDSESDSDVEYLGQEILDEEDDSSLTAAYQGVLQVKEKSSKTLKTSPRKVDQQSDSFSKRDQQPEIISDTDEEEEVEEDEDEEEEQEEEKEDVNLTKDVDDVEEDVDDVEEDVDDVEEDVDDEEDVDEDEGPDFDEEDEEMKSDSGGDNVEVHDEVQKEDERDNGEKDLFSSTCEEVPIIIEESSNESATPILITNTTESNMGMKSKQSPAKDVGNSVKKITTENESSIPISSSIMIEDSDADSKGEDTMVLALEASDVEFIDDVTTNETQGIIPVRPSTAHTDLTKVMNEQESLATLHSNGDLETIVSDSNDESEMEQDDTVVFVGKRKETSGIQTDKEKIKSVEGIASTRDLAVVTSPTLIKQKESRKTISSDSSLDLERRQKESVTSVIRRRSVCAGEDLVDERNRLVPLKRVPTPRPKKRLSEEHVLRMRTSFSSREEFEKGLTEIGEDSPSKPSPKRKTPSKINEDLEEATPPAKKTPKLVTPSKSTMCSPQSSPKRKTPSKIIKDLEEATPPAKKTPKLVTPSKSTMCSPQPSPKRKTPSKIIEDLEEATPPAKKTPKRVTPSKSTMCSPQPSPKQKTPSKINKDLEEATPPAKTTPKHATSSKSPMCSPKPTGETASTFSSPSMSDEVEQTRQSSGKKKATTPIIRSSVTSESDGEGTEMQVPAIETFAKTKSPKIKSPKPKTADIMSSPHKEVEAQTVSEKQQSSPDLLSPTLAVVADTKLEIKGRSRRSLPVTKPDVEHTPSRRKSSRICEIFKRDSESESTAGESVLSTPKGSKRTSARARQELRDSAAKRKAKKDVFDYTSDSTVLSESENEEKREGGRPARKSIAVTKYQSLDIVEEEEGPACEDNDKALATRQKSIISTSTLGQGADQSEETTHKTSEKEDKPEEKTAARGRKRPSTPSVKPIVTQKMDKEPASKRYSLRGGK